MIFKNDFVCVSFNVNSGMGRDYLALEDLTDHYNGTSAYTRKVRGIRKAWSFLEQIFQDDRLKDDLKFRDITRLLDEKFNLNTHIYCSID